jgi:hypothetical protein
MNTPIAELLERMLALRMQHDIIVDAVRALDAVRAAELHQVIGQTDPASSGSARPPSEENKGRRNSLLTAASRRAR